MHHLYVIFVSVHFYLFLHIQLAVWWTRKASKCNFLS